jgi:hypothetical protein
MVAQTRGGVNYRKLGHSVVILPEAAARHPASSTPSADLTPGVLSGNGLNQRGGDATLIKLHHQLKQSYRIEGRAAVFGLVRFSARIGQKFFT